MIIDKIRIGTYGKQDIGIYTSYYNAYKYIDSYIEALSRLKGKDRMHVCIVMNVPSESEIQLLVNGLKKAEIFASIITIDEREKIFCSYNRAIAELDTDLVGAWDIDDVRSPTSLIEQANTINHFNADATYGDYILVKEHGSKDGTYIIAENYSKDKFVLGCYWSPFPMIKKKTLEKIGLYDEQYYTSGDYELQIRFAYSDCIAVKTNSLIGYRTHPITESMTHRKRRPLENTAIHLRYKNYIGIKNEKLVRYIRKAGKYNIDNITNNGKSISISKLRNRVMSKGHIKYPFLCVIQEITKLLSLRIIRNVKRFCRMIICRLINVFTNN